MTTELNMCAYISDNYFLKNSRLYQLKNKAQGLYRIRGRVTWFTCLCVVWMTPSCGTFSCQAVSQSPRVFPPTQQRRVDCMSEAERLKTRRRPSWEAISLVASSSLASSHTIIDCLRLLARRNSISRLMIIYFSNEF